MKYCISFYNHSLIWPVGVLFATKYACCDIHLSSPGRSIKGDIYTQSVVRSSSTLCHSCTCDLLRQAITAMKEKVATRTAAHDSMKKRWGLPAINTQNSFLLICECTSLSDNVSFKSAVKFFFMVRFHLASG